MCILQINIQITNFYRCQVLNNSQLRNGSEKAQFWTTNKLDRRKVGIWGRKLSAQLLNKEKRTLKQKQVERKSNEIVTYASIQ